MSNLYKLWSYKVVVTYYKVIVTKSRKFPGIYADGKDTPAQPGGAGRVQAESGVYVFTLPAPRQRAFRLCVLKSLLQTSEHRFICPGNK